MDWVRSSPGSIYLYLQIECSVLTNIRFAKYYDYEKGWNESPQKINSRLERVLEVNRSVRVQKVISLKILKFSFIIISPNWHNI